MKSLIRISALPPRTTKGTILRLLIQVGGVDKKLIGRIEVQGASATAEVPARQADRVAAALDGATLATTKLRAWCESAPAAPSRPGQEDHFERLKSLLELESQAEDKRALELLARLSPNEAERTGRSLHSLAMIDEQPGLGGRALVRLAKASGPLPWHRLRVGTPVMLSCGEQSCRGVVCHVADESLQVALEQPPDFEQDGPLRIDHCSDQVSSQRQRQALDRARSSVDGPLAQFRKVLTGARGPRFADIERLDQHAAALNDPQRAAIEHCLAAEDYAVIHGPPGTGKTTTLVELIAQAVRRGQRVLACAPSNLAVDNLLERLLERDVGAVRLGHPARVLPALRDRTLDYMVDSHDDMKLARQLMQQARDLRRRAARWTRAKQTRQQRQELREEAKLLVEDGRRIESQVVDSILQTSPVLCATTTGLDSEVLGRMEFDWAVIDEACQSTEPGCWIPLLRCQRLVLAGDHCQLPPTVISQQASRQGFNVSLMERLMALHGPQVAKRLEVQYRMHEQIAGFSSQQFYEASLRADPSVAKHRLADLPGVSGMPLTEQPVAFFDTAGAGFHEEQEKDGSSRRNAQEANVVVRLLQQLRDAGVDDRQLAVISPYAAQVRLLRERLAGGRIEIDSVDGFQGREMEAVVISLVRSNEAGELGFLKDVRRINVALTRARRGLIVVGDSATIGSLPFYQRLLEYFESVGGYRTVWELDLG